MPKHITDIPTDLITSVVQEASLEARKRALDTGCEVISTDEDSQLISEKKLEDGTIIRKSVPQSINK